MQNCGKILIGVISLNCCADWLSAPLLHCLSGGNIAARDALPFLRESRYPAASSKQYYFINRNGQEQCAHLIAHSGATRLGNDNLSAKTKLPQRTEIIRPPSKLSRVYLVCGSACVVSSPKRMITNQFPRSVKGAVVECSGVQIGIALVLRFCCGRNGKGPGFLLSPS